MRAVPISENIAKLKFLKAEALAVADEQENIALKNDVVLFETPKDKQSFIDGFINGCCWQKGRGDENAVSFADFLLKDYRMVEIRLADKFLGWELCGTGQTYTTKEIFEIYSSQNKQK